MSTNYTTLFTLIGKHVDKVRDYYAIIATLDSDRDAIVAAEVTASSTYLSDGLIAVFESFKSNIVSWVASLITRISLVVTDPVLVANNFPFGTVVDVQTAWGALIKEMAATDKNVTASAMTTGSITKTVINSTSGNLVLGTKLDGFNPPMSGALPNTAYAGITSQMYPDDETITATCTQDSENGAARGAESFSIAGTGAQANAYSSTGENVGQLNGINVADSAAATYAANSGFDNWTGSPPEVDSWAVLNGVAGTDYERSSGTTTTLIENTGFALKTLQTNDDIDFTQTLNPALFTRNRAYFISLWAKRVENVLDPPEASVYITVNGGTLVTLNIAPTSTTDWTQYSGQFIIPAEIGIDNDSLILNLHSSNDATKDPVFIDQIVITPCTYVAGIAVAIFGGSEKFLIGDSFQFRLQNDAAGKFQSFARKAYKVQLPTDASPTISDSLVA